MFYPSEALKLPFDPPDTVPIADFMLSDEHRSIPLTKARPFFTCGLTGKSYSPTQAKERVNLIARGLLKELGWSVNAGNEWDKVVGVFSVNTIDTILVAWACHKINSIDTPANAAYSAFELEHQLRDSGAKCVFTCGALLDTTLTVTRKLSIPDNRIFILEVPGTPNPTGYKTVDDIAHIGSTAPALEPLQWTKGQGARQTAMLCYSSGTSGLPKGVMISHRNIIANTLQYTTFDQPGREQRYGSGFQHNALGLLPFSHIYGLVVIAHASIYNGDGVVVLPRFEMHSCLKAIQDHRISNLFLVPPIIINMVNSPDTLRKYDLSAVAEIFTGAAPLGKETAQALMSLYPDWVVRQGYGLTETSTVVTCTPVNDIYLGSSGSLIPGFEAKLVTPEGAEVTGYDQPGELWARSPSVVLGYLHNPTANKETFVDGFMRTGDEAVVKPNPASGREHFFIVDRIKELIKVKGMQVAPAELEAHLLTHAAVADCAVVPIPDDAAGERPKAFVVRAAGGALEEPQAVVKRDIMQHVEREKARHKWVKEVEFVEAIPKSPSGKILRRLLRDRDREVRGTRSGKAKL